MVKIGQKFKWFFDLPARYYSPSVNNLLAYLGPSSIYSWSISHILEHEFFCLGSQGSKEKKSGFEFF